MAEENPKSAYIVHRYPGYIEIERTDDALHKKKPLRGVRCGLAAPSPRNPGGYFCLVGQEQRKLITGQRALMMLEDFEFQTPYQLFTTIFDRMGIFASTEIWTDFSPRFHSFIEQLDRFWRTERGSQEIEIKPAPYAGSFIQGERIVAKWLREIKGGLILPKDSIVRAELREIKAEDLKGEPENRYYAINGLRYVLASFEASDFLGKTAGGGAKELPVEAWT